MRTIQHKILIVEDDPQIHKFLTITLASHDYATLSAYNGAEAIRLVTSVKPDAILLDLGLPDTDGQHVIQTIREWSKIPIIVISARDQEDQKIIAFDNGANDYVTKPFSTGELLARLRACLRDAIVAQIEKTDIRVGDLHIDLMKRAVFLRGERIKLSPKEFSLLKVLAMNPGKLLTHKHLMQEVWGEAYSEDNQYLRIYIAQLRQKLEKDPAREQFIINEPGIGYRMEFS